MKKVMWAIENKVITDYKVIVLKPKGYIYVRLSMNWIYRSQTKIQNYSCLHI